MRLLKKLKYALLFLVLISSLLLPLVHPPQALSADFSTGYDITFNFDSAGKARVTQKIQLKNQTDNLYASEYSLTIGSERVSNITGSDRLGGIVVKATKKDQSTQLSAKLNDKVVGKGKIASITISYTIDDLAIKRGLIWDVNIPKIVTQEDIDNFSLKLIVPKAYGSLHSIAPTPASSKKQGNSTIYSFNKTHIDYNISASFGTVQQFKFNLKYRLKNNNVLNAIGTVALPPDTNQQQTFFEKISPEPRKIYVDPDGNYLADFLVKGRSNLEVGVVGIARISDQTETLQAIKPKGESNLNQYLKADKYWEVENATIQSKAKELKTVQEIYKFVTRTLKYNYDRLKQENSERFGAARALQETNNAICTDYTDLFVALARAAGIPARELEGFAYTDNANTRPTRVGGLDATNVLHAWPEYYDMGKKRWVAVDPTWESTTGGVNYFDKLDTNHFVLAIHGASSVWPIPAGGYKITGNETDDLKIDFDTSSPDTGIKLEGSFDFHKVVGGIPSSGKVTVRNTSGRALLSPKFSFEVSGAQISSPLVIEEVALLPFETRIYEVKLTAGQLLKTEKQSVKVAISGFVGKTEFKEEFKDTVLIKPFFMSINPVSILFLAAISALVVLYPPVFRRLKALVRNRLFVRKSEPPS